MTDLDRLQAWMSAGGLQATPETARALQATSWTGKSLSAIEWEVVKLWEADCPRCAPWTPIERRTL